MKQLSNIRRATIYSNIYTYLSIVVEQVYNMLEALIGAAFANEDGFCNHVRPPLRRTSKCKLESVLLWTGRQLSCRTMLIISTDALVL